MEFPHSSADFPTSPLCVPSHSLTAFLFWLCTLMSIIIQCSSSNSVFFRSAIHRDTTKPFISFTLIPCCKTTMQKPFKPICLQTTMACLSHAQFRLSSKTSCSSKHASSFCFPYCCISCCKNPCKKLMPPNGSTQQLSRTNLSQMYTKWMSFFTASFLQLQKNLMLKQTTDTAKHRYYFKTIIIIILKSFYFDDDEIDCLSDETWWWWFICL